ncbi:hypothetical protein G7K71_13875 [Desulfofundulus sp. TPOSR]|uniref:hypothetical protein n=1 Tax=Desulfofundulus sp. TPOSR TaxID=2714340 RepID=UPI0014096C6E|nr:hypothetical protein [Desulfofundulus sp. TPOSR]NHM28046.1 hypothetical protein [Desulfofundulus sp. TPOSR]
MRVLLATGFKELDRSVAAELSRQIIESAGECYYREGLPSLAKERGADVVVLSPHLPGQTDTVDLVKELRMAGLRVILLPGRRDDPKAVYLARKAVALGVYDIVWDPVSPEVVINRVLKPATLAESGVEPEGDVLEPAAGKPGKKVPFWRRLFRKPAKKETPGDSPAGTVNGGKPGAASLETVPGGDRMRDAALRGSDRESGTGGLHVGPPVFPGNSDRAGVLVLADRETALLLRKAGFAVVSDPRDARVCICDVDRVAFAPRDIPLLVVRTGSVSDLAAVMARPGAILVDRSEIPRKVSAILNSPADTGDAGSGSPAGEKGAEKLRAGKTGDVAPRSVSSGEDEGGSRPNLFVLPGRGAGNGASVPEHGVIYIVCPGEPPSAGQIAAVLAKQADGSALICATGVSAGALALGMKPEDLVLSDWRVPGADAPVIFEGVTVWPVDPGKFLNTRDVLPHALVSQIRKRFSVVVVDCGGDLSLCTGAPRDAAVVVVRTGKDTADWVVERWVKDYGGNVVIVGPGRALALERVSNGYVVRVVNNPGAFEERKAK